MKPVKAILISTDNEEVSDLVDTSDTLVESEITTYEFQDLVFHCRFKKKLADGTIRFISTLGNTYIFKPL